MIASRSLQAPAAGFGQAACPAAGLARRQGRRQRSGRSGRRRGGANAGADQVVEEIKAAGGEAVANYNSVADFKSAQGIIDTATQTWGRLDILVNNMPASCATEAVPEHVDGGFPEFTSQVHYMGTVYCYHQSGVADHA